MIWQGQMTTDMKKIREFPAPTLMEAFRLAMDWTKNTDDGGFVWFRGVNDCSFELEPGAYWRDDYDEYSPLLDFVQEGRAYAEIGELDDWRTYYLAQHSGIPTRLLDWTESFSAALFFALDGWNGSTTPCVWVMRPELLNQQSIGSRYVVSPEQNRELDIWLPRRIGEGAQKVKSRDGYATYDSSLPLAIYPRKGNERMIAQQGTFTVHGTQKVKLNNWIAENASNPDEVLCKIILEKWPKAESLRQLQALGIRRHTMYPDLHNYIQYLRDYYRW